MLVSRQVSVAMWAVFMTYACHWSADDLILVLHDCGGIQSHGKCMSSTGNYSYTSLTSN